MPRLNRHVLGFHLREAEQALAELTVALQRSIPDDEDSFFEVGLAHVYHHLNFAWHIRHLTDAESDREQHRQFSAWRQFPTDLRLPGEPPHPK